VVKEWYHAKDRGMTAYSIDILKARGLGEDYLSRAAELYGLSQFITRAAIIPDSLMIADFLNAVVPTDHGRQAIDLLRSKYPGHSNNFYTLTVFTEFWWEELLVDPHHTDIVRIIDGISKFLISQELRICWLYGAVLYRRAFELHSHDDGDDLSPDQIRRLLAGSPQGVCQFRDLVSGPLGILRSAQLRYAPCYTTIPLWHCSDPSCDAIHDATLRLQPQHLTSAREVLQDALSERYGNFSDWDTLLTRYAGEIDHYDHNALPGVPWHLGNVLSESELTTVLLDLLGSNSRDLRQRLGAAAQGAPKEIVANFDIAAKLQAVLMCSDQQIVRRVERLVTTGAINIPIQEVRRPALWKADRGWFDLQIELSRMGIRTVSDHIPLQNARLKQLINEIYRLDANTAQLDWRLRYQPGIDIDERLDAYVNGHAPPNVIRDHIFNSKQSLEAAFQALRYGYFSPPDNEAEEAELVDKIMWKLGFRVQHFALTNARFVSSLEALYAAVEGMGTRTGLSTIRSAAANFFVDLEDLLKRSLSFSIWCLLSDHYEKTRFKFNPSTTQGIIYRTFSTHQLRSTSTDFTQFDPAGNDTLYPLIRGFTLLADSCEEYSRDRHMYLRPPDKLPGFAKYDGLHLFPFRHTALINDISQPQQSRIRSLLTEVTSGFEAIQLTNLRNRLQHDRPVEDLPTQDEIVLAITTVANVVKKLEQSGLFPLTYNINEERTDRWQRKQTTLINYNGNEVVVSERSELAGTSLPELEDHTIIVPWVRIAGTAEVLRFSLEQDSDYVRLWHGYPLRRPRAAGLAEGEEGRRAG
jgi:hypothetical protein